MLIFDVSEANGGEPFDTLSDALSYADSVLLSGQKKGGMSIKYIQSSDNKYVQYRLMATAWSSAVNDWQGVDDEPTSGSSNLVKSGGVCEYVENKQNALKNEYIDVKVNSRVKKDNNEDTVIRDATNEFVVCDSAGRVVFKINSDGATLNSIKINEILSVLYGNSNKTITSFDSAGMHSKHVNSEYVEYDDDTFVICDGSGNVIFKVDATGVHSIDGEDNTIPYDIVFPKNLYCLDGVQRNIWHSSILSRYNPYETFLRFEGTASYQRRCDIVASLKSGNTDGKTMVAALYDLNKMQKVKQITSTIKVGTPNASGLSGIKVQFIGSSTVQLAYFKYALENYVSNYTLVGMRHKPDLADVKHEGRGGASLASYRTVATDSKSHYYPFWQPNGNYRYYGATGFWLYAKDNANSESEAASANGAYYNGCYNADILAMFDNTTGFLTNPSNGDIMYDTANATFKVYNGSSWVITDKNSYTWGFDYSKYLDMWGFATPDVVCVTLGANDFRNKELPLDFDTWNSQMEELITSIHAESSNIKIVLCNQGPFGNHGYTGDVVPVQNYKMWLHLKDIIETFDNRENENIYVLAQGSEISAEYGFRRKANTDALTNPTEIFADDERMVVLNQDTVHPYLSLDNMGTPIAAFLQYIRK